MRKGRIFIVLILLALAGGISYRVYRLVIEKKEGSARSDASVVVVKTAPVEKGTIRRDISLTGDVEAMTSVQVFPKSPGRLVEITEKHLEKIRNLFKEEALSTEPLDKVQEVEEGDSVDSGQVIAVIDHENLDAQVNQVRAALTTATAQLTQAEVTREQTEKDLERFRNLVKEGAEPEQRLEKIEAEYKGLLQQENVAKARVEQSRAALKQAQIQLAECFILAPISGIISEKFLETGDMAMPTRPIFAIIDIDEVKVVADLPERYLGEVRKTALVKIDVDAFPKRVFQGAVTRISPTVNVVNRTAELEITVPNPDYELKPGMFARVTLNLVEKEGVPVIPEAAVLRASGEAYVFVIEEGIARRREVALGLQEGPRLEVRAGLQPGDMLVIAGQQKIADGTLVEIQD